MPSFVLEFEVLCEKCGAGLCNKSSTRDSLRRSMPQVTVEPCSKCLDNADDAGYNRGYQEGEASHE